MTKNVWMDLLLTTIFSWILVIPLFFVSQGVVISVAAKTLQAQIASGKITQADAVNLVALLYEGSLFGIASAINGVLGVKPKLTTGSIICSLSLVLGMSFLVTSYVYGASWNSLLYCQAVTILVWRDPTLFFFFLLLSFASIQMVISVADNKVQQNV